MKRRCGKTTDEKNLRNYVRRGICYDPRWQSFESFLDDMGDRPPGTELDRINNGLGYYKANCRWTTRVINNNNKRTNRLIRLPDGSVKTVADAARSAGLSYQTMASRVRRGVYPVILAAALAGCAPAVTVRSPICEPPPIPASAMQPCVEPTEALKTGSLEELYVQAVRDTGPWGQCIRAHDKLIEFVKYRDAICQKFREDNITKPSTGWRWPWQ